jgi:hypothetical protein
MTSAIDPRRRALLVMDYQASILGRLPGAQDLLARAADASADPQPGVHEFLTEKIFPRQAQVITIAEVKELLSGPAGA